MVLSDKKILEEIDKGNILIEPFIRECLGSNSYDLHLGKHLGCYKDRVLDAKANNKLELFEIPLDGYVLNPGILYLAVTEEYTETHKHIPFIKSKVSANRLGIIIHSTSGIGDIGFCNTWTLEISCIHPVRIYRGMPIGQLIYHCIDGEVEQLYNKKQNAKYNKRTMKPVESMMWKFKF